ncbi:hypothetical protein ACIBQ6_48100 [Nonomuraea sp. NPDC049655]|uniref:hypothetical protein n=1 Tax=Nonomuraea sp. NPDC049655 TaxID=3364355 RepID=UPI00378E1DD4
MVKWLVLLLACSLTGCAGPVGTAGRTSPSAPAPPESAASESAPDGSAPDGSSSGDAAGEGGREVGGCADARCEVTLRAGDVLKFGQRHGVSRFAVASVQGDKVTWEADFTGGGDMSSQGEQGGASTCKFDEGGGCSGYIRGVTTLTLNDVVLRFLSFDRGRAVVRVTPKR